MDTVLRIVVIYFFLMLALRIIGKREFGTLEPFELVTLLLIPEIVTEALHRGDASLTNAFVGVSTLLTLVFFTGLLAYRSRRFGRVVDGSPTVLVRHGSLVAEAMNRERVAPEEIASELRRYGLEQISQVKWALLESDGHITVVPWEQPTPRRFEGQEGVPA